MASSLPYAEEAFGILTDDDLYLDCVLVKPPEMTDEALQTLRVWVPKYPLTKTSVITCARRVVQSYGADHKTAHLVFDLRGTGDSDGVPGDMNFQMDLHAVAAWAKERFGRVNFGFFGTPTSEHGQVYMWPLRAGTVMESYFYRATSSHIVPVPVLYLSTYGNFTEADDTLCTQLAKAGYNVYGIDPLRYLLHASAQETLTPDNLWEDLRLLVQMVSTRPILVGQPVASGLAILWATRPKETSGVIAIGRAQVGFKPAHIFQNRNPYTFLLSRHTPNIAPRPFALVKQENHPLGGDDDELATLYKSSKKPHRLERTNEITAEFLIPLLQWVQKNQG